MIASQGVGTIVLTNARKVEADYFGSHLIRRPEELREKLIEGLAQSGDVYVPNVVVAKRLKPFLEDELDAMFHPSGARLVAHPRMLEPAGTAESDGSQESRPSGRMAEVFRKRPKRTNLRTCLWLWDLKAAGTCGELATQERRRGSSEEAQESIRD